MAEAYQEESIVFCNLPRSGDLCHVVVSIDSKEKKDSSVKSDYQWQLLKTRILIFSDINVLASPMLGELRYIHVVCKHDYLKSGFLNKLLMKNRLKIERTTALTMEIYEECLMYHLITKLSPTWNRIEKLFVEGRYFLMKRGQLTAVELHCVISEGKLFLHVLPQRLWLRQVDLLDFDLPLATLEHSVSEKFYKDLSHEPQWVHVLPSFKRGRIVYVANYIPEKCTFTDYREMRRHWKNTYGFRLPEEGSSMTYVGINFFGPLDYTYPLVCVRRGMHMNIGDSNTIYNFINAVCTKASVICGSSLKPLNLGVPIQSHFMVEPESKWEEKNLLNIDKHVLENFLTPSEECGLSNNTQLSLCSQSQTNSRSSCSDYDTSNEDWFIKCSTFIEGLSQIDPKRSRSRALSKPHFIKRRRQFINLPSKKPIFLRECENTQERSNFDSNSEKVIVSTNLCLNNVLIKKEKAELQIPVSQISVHKSSNEDGNSTNVFENGVKSNATGLSMAVPYKPVFKKHKKVVNAPTTKMIASGVNVPKTSSNSLQKMFDPDAALSKNKMLKKPIFIKHKPELVNTLPTVKPMSDKTRLEKKPSEVKKAPIIYSESEIEELHRVGKLSKVNTTSLMLFLRKNGILCKSHDKKSLLLTKTEMLLSQYASKT